jgi:hypothetical protein
MASNTATDLPPEAIAFATRMYDAARAGQLDVFQQALPAGLPANMTNEKGDSLVCAAFQCSSLLSSNLFKALKSGHVRAFDRKMKLTIDR